MLKTSFEEHQGKRLRIARLGSGPPLICLHGYPDNLQIWSELAAALSVEYQVIAFDWPGMGQSEPWPGGATPEHLAGRLLVLLDDWGLSRASFLGMDMGGQPALVFAAKYPQRTASLVIMNSLVISGEKTSWEIALLRKFGWNRFLLRHFPRVMFTRSLRTFLPAGYRIDRELRADLWNAFRQPEVRSFISKMCAGYQGTLPELPKFYSQVQAPALILWAGKDRHFPPAQARGLHQQIRRSELRIVADARHWMPLYFASDLALVIAAFLRRHA